HTVGSPRSSGHRLPLRPCSASPVSTLPGERHSSRCGHTTRENVYPYAAWPLPSAGFEGVALDRPLRGRGDWTDSFVRSCPRAFPLHRRDHRRDPSLQARCSSHPSQVLRSPRTSAARRSTSPSAYTNHPVATTTAQTDLPCSALLLQRVLRPLPRSDLAHVFLRTEVRAMLPSP